ncbi:MAG TPA: N-acetyl-gamma-glutamyl-phosphate reductase [Vicinamibacterales bacterium]|nr:N-acetyl-gamma-glutamyl-phosphate reductase [Vicinamibacterales bacterium]
MNNYASPSVGVAGATGYAGRELLRLLARHPRARVTTAMASGGANGARPAALARVWDGEIRAFDEAALAGCDVAFLALPEAASAAVAPALVARGVRVIDLSGAFRLCDADSRRRWYPETTEVPEGAVYGLPEVTGDALSRATLVACAGCYPTAALLPLLPLVRADLIDRSQGVVIDAKSGVSGAGKAPSERTHFSECHGSVAAYGLFGHRHEPEMEQALGCDVTFVPHLVPLDRGILSTIYARLREGVSAADVAAALDSAYAGAPFVRLTHEDLPEIKHVAYTNFCDIGWRVDERARRVVLVSCIDNLLKGAAGQAVQVFNLAFGYDERLGLT